MLWLDRKSLFCEIEILERNVSVRLHPNRGFLEPESFLIDDANIKNGSLFLL